jgi:hypothetical protein
MSNEKLNNHSVGQWVHPPWRLIMLCYVCLIKLIFDEIQSMQYGHYNQVCQA